MKFTACWRISHPQKGEIEDTETKAHFKAYCCSHFMFHYCQLPLWFLCWKNGNRSQCPKTLLTVLSSCSRSPFCSCFHTLIILTMTVRFQCIYMSFWTRERFDCSYLPWPDKTHHVGFFQKAVVTLLVWWLRWTLCGCSRLWIIVMILDRTHHGVDLSN